MNSLTLKRKSFRLYFGSGKVLVGLLDFKSSDGQMMSVVGSIPMHFRQHKKQSPRSMVHSVMDDIKSCAIYLIGL